MKLPKIKLRPIHYAFLLFVLGIIVFLGSWLLYVTTYMESKFDATVPPGITALQILSATSITIGYFGTYILFLKSHFKLVHSLLITIGLLLVLIGLFLAGTFGALFTDLTTISAGLFVYLPLVCVGLDFVIRKANK